jgi:DNA-directed RNA polymerase specialized sigma24 family protein
VDFDSVFPATDANPESLLAIDEALGKLAREHPEKSAVVKLRFYAGLSLTDAANALGVSPATAKRHWAYARAFLYSELLDAR